MKSKVLVSRMLGSPQCMQGAVVRSGRRDRDAQSAEQNYVFTDHGLPFDVIADQMPPSLVSKRYNFIDHQTAIMGVSCRSPEAQHNRIGRYHHWPPN
jgi:hypothetical protein